VAGDAVTYTNGTTASTGAATLSDPATRAFPYTPASIPTRRSSDLFRARDAALDSNTATVSITITPVNDAPVAAAGTLTTPEDTPAKIGIAASNVGVEAAKDAVVVKGTQGAGTWTVRAALPFNHTATPIG